MKRSLFVTLAAAAVLLPATPAAADTVHPGTFAGLGFDACTAPTSATMQAWLQSPYRALGIYFGGTNRACLQPQLTAQWVADQTAAGWHLMPIYLGPQASCTASTKPNKIDNTRANAQGRETADDAVVQARAIGLAPESVLIYDMEAYRTDDAVCRAGVLAFISGWTARLHDYGYFSGFYSSMNSGMADKVANYNVRRVRPPGLHRLRPLGRGPHRPGRGHPGGVLVAATPDEAVPRRPHRDLGRRRHQHRQRHPGRGAPAAGPVRGRHRQRLVRPAGPEHHGHRLTGHLPRQRHRAGLGRRPHLRLRLEP